MPTPNIVQIHALMNYTGTLLNRDDSGLAKTMLYGGHRRTRVSSQCLKRHWRKDDGIHSLSAIAPDPVRTKELGAIAIMGHVLELMPDVDEELAKRVLEAINVGLYGENGNDANSRQLLLFGRSEVEFLSGTTVRILRENTGPDEAVAAVRKMLEKKAEGENFAALRQNLVMPAGIVGASFGRMVASDQAANIEAPVHVAHAFTTHAEEKEIEYFTAMEELAARPGAGHIGDTEINSGIYYVYVCIDVRGLTANTTGRRPEDWLDSDRGIAAETVSRLASLIATVSPGAKKGSTAPYGYAKAMLIEAGERVLRTLSGGYRQPSKPEFGDAIERLRQELRSCDQVFGAHEARRMLVNADSTAEYTLDEMTGWIRQTILDGEAQ